MYKPMGLGEQNLPQIPRQTVDLGNLKTLIPTTNHGAMGTNTTYQMYHKTLCFIANAMNRQTRPNGKKLFNPRTLLGLCYDCGGDH